MLKVNNLSIRFGGLVAVNSVNLTIERNEICGLIGPNGAGKTTLFNIISGVHKPNEGNIVFKGKNIQGLQPFQICELGISRTYQNINLFRNMTVLENLLVGTHCRLKAGLPASILRFGYQKREERESVEKAMALLKFFELESESNADAQSLPYGKQRLLEIARAMASEPDIMLLDEPAAGMNTTEKTELMKYIEKIHARGITLIIVDHDMRMMMGVTERLYVLNYGKQIATGTPDQVRNNPEVIQAYLGGD